MKGFFYGQTEYNYLENSISLENYVNYCVDYGYEFISLTDKNLHGYYKFYNLCVNNNVKPIIGLKIMLSNTPNNFILAYAKNDIGLSNLFKLSKIQETDSISIDKINECKEGLFLVIPNDNLAFEYIEKKEFDNAINEIKKFELDVYLGIDKNRDNFSNFINTYDISILPSCNCNYILKEDFNVYQTLKKIGNTKISLFHSHIKTKEELISCTNDFDFDFDFINNIKYNLNSKVDLPSYSNSIDNSSLYLQELCVKGLQRRLKLMNKFNLYNKYLQRLQFELEVINQMGYSDYFLIVWDLIKYSKKEGILVGPGRGSAAGSLVSYCLGITEIDPLEYDLYFERFLNPQRVSMPDIDIDFPDNKRDEVIQYVKNKYGDNHVCYISAFNTFGVKSSIRDICRVNNVNLDHASLMLKHIDSFGLEDALDKYSSRDELLEVLTIANKINGLIRHISTHAAGIILSSVNLDENIPLRQGVNGVYQSQLEAVDLEHMGYLKIDFLGIRNLTLIDNIVNNIEGFKLNNIPLNDKKTFELLQKGDTNGIFQLESTGIKNVLKKLKPTDFNDIVSVLALYRPGPMDNIDLFIQGKNSGKVNYLVKELEPILKTTYGIIVYQEQIMQIANVIASYTYAEADILRRAVSKKSKNILDENRNIFVKKALANKFSEKISNEIYDLIVKFADYGFNKSHSVAYARLSYEMAYLKANYTLLFISEMINNSIGDLSEITSYINYAKSKGIEVITPKINHSSNKTIIIKNKILLPFQTIQKLGNNTAKLIIEEREKNKFASFDDFKNRTSNFINSNNLTNLIFADSFSEFKSTKKFMNEKSNINSSFAKYVKDNIDENEEYDFPYLRKMEVESLGFNLNYDIFKNSIKDIEKIKLSNQNDIKDGKSIKVVAFIDNVKKIETKNKEEMAFLDLDLNYCKISAVAFPSVFCELEKLDAKKLMVIDGVIQKRNLDLQIVIRKIVNI